jgi:hypothetical protein
MARDKAETSRFRTDQEKFNDNYNHVFNKKECKCEECQEMKPKRMATKEEMEELNIEYINAKLARSCTEQ